MYPCRSSPSRSYGDFEEEWIKLGEESYVGIFESGNSPDDPYEPKVKTGVKRKISESEDSLILTRRKMSKTTEENDDVFPFKNQEIEKEDIVLTKFRRDNPTKYKALEGRFLGNSPASPISIASSPPASPKNCNMPSNPPLPIYSPSSPSDVSSNTALQISVPELNSISNLPTPDHNLTPSRNTTVPQTTPAQTSGQYPLKAELSALCELVDSVRVDLLQTSMIVNYIQAYN
ncbi:uncharacterized protein LOC128169490 [Crassostrea angulata]|uniref:uncharacterized protein LOC128169490 n=1 Tax=Magallana angulata TaxID=2784310 RepID=UPI0022B096E2|nr:uncharacterized protein LOC128169490 [Crassostrea angulata]